jgi:large repetitive protein
VLQNEWSNATHSCFQIGPPAITSATPTSGSPGDPIDLAGRNFFDVSSVKFGGVAASWGQTPSDPPAHITADVPNITCPVPISVTTVFGTGTSPFTFSAPLTISPLAVSSGKTGTSLTIGGSGFCGVTGVRFTGLTGPVSAPFTISGGAIHTTVPSAAISGRVTVVRGVDQAQTDEFDVTPAVTTFSPTAGGFGTSLTINGSGFDSTSDVEINGFDAGVVAPVSANKLVLSLPDGATTGKIVVRTTAGGQSLQSVATLKIGPQLDDVGGLTVRAGDHPDLTGHNLAGVNAVKIGSVLVPFTHDGDLEHGITVTVPDSAVTGKVFVSSPTDGSFTTLATLHILPTISSVDPVAPAAVGTAGAKLLLHGKTFTGTKLVQFTGFGGAPSVSAPFSVGPGGTTLTVTVPTAAVSGSIRVTNGGGATDSPTVQILPKTLAISPSSGPVGTPVTITGTGLTSSATATVGGAGIDGVVRVSATQLRGTIGAGAVTGAALVTTGAGTSPSGPTFKVTPGITTFTQDVQALDVVTITGNNLNEVNPNGLKVGSLVVPISTQSTSDLTFQVPVNAVTGKISLTSPSGTTVSHDALAILPTIDTVSVSTGITGTHVTLTGKTLTGSSVKFTGITGAQNISATAGVSLGGTVLSTAVPAAAVSGPVTVTNAGGSTPAGTFTVIPKVTGFSPSSGPTGATITVNGSGFDSTATLSIGSAHGGDLAVTPTSPTSAKFHVPNGADTGHLTVTTTSGAGATSDPSTGTFAVTMSVLGLSATSGIAGDPLTITGKGFGTNPIVKIDGQAAALTTALHDATQVTVTVPSNTGTGKVTVQNGSTSVLSAADFTITTAPVGSDSPQFAAAAA